MINPNAILRPNGFVIGIGQRKVPSWTPEEDSDNISFWGDFYDNSCVVESGGKVTALIDKIGVSANMTQNLTNRQAVYDSSNKALIVSADRYTCNNSAQAGFFVISNANRAEGFAAGCPLLGYEVYSASSVFLKQDNADYTISVDGGSINTGDASIDGSAINPGGLSGTNIAISGFTPFPNETTKHIVYFQINAAVAWDNLFGFRFAGDNNAYANCYCHEFILFKTLPDSEIRLLCEGYLANKWQ